MERELAHHVARVASRAGADLTDLVPLLKEHCAPEEYAEYAKALAAAAAEVHFRVVKLIFSKYPEIEADFLAKVKRYQRVL